MKVIGFLLSLFLGEEFIHLRAMSVPPIGGPCGGAIDQIEGPKGEKLRSSGRPFRRIIDEGP
jgi:hypothetical protein